ncbi:MAG TPA: PLDc N-terminal domain-containing protein, partial [Coriobacteriia bacterium]|nr:PLDc N-terminal domain-containing protein [Coriobacteriia bacterium]
MENALGAVLAAIGLLAPVIALVYVIAVAIVLINDQRDPTKTVSWLLLIYMLPGLGLILYYFLGRNFRKKAQQSGWWEKVAETERPVRDRMQAKYYNDAREGIALAGDLGFGEVAHMAQVTESMAPLPAYDVRIMPTGAEKFAQLKKDLAAAQDTINIMYFIWERDELTRALIDILIDRCKAGVEVRILNDYIG